MAAWFPWMLLLFAYGTLAGAYYDVWWHAMGLVETFFTVAHGILYTCVFLGGVSVLIHVVRKLVRLGRFSPAEIPHAPALALAGTGSLFQLLAGVSDGVYHTLFGFDITLWSPPHMLAVFGGILVTLGVAGLFAAQPGIFGRIGYTLALGCSLSAFMFGVTEYDVASSWSIVNRWEAYGPYLPAMAAIFGSFLLGYGYRETGRPVGSLVFTWAFLGKLLVFFAWGQTAIHMRFPLLFLVAGVGFDVMVRLGERSGAKDTYTLPAVVFTAIGFAVVRLQGPVALETVPFVVALAVSALLAPVAARIGAFAADSRLRTSRQTIEIAQPGDISHT